MTERTSVTLSLTCDAPQHVGNRIIWHYADADLDAARQRADADGWWTYPQEREPLHRCPHCVRASA